MKGFIKLTLLGSLFVISAQLGAGVAHVSAHRGVNFRAYPNGPLIPGGALPYGTRFVSAQRIGSWYQVRLSNGRTGFVYGSAVRVGGGSAGRSSWSATPSWGGEWGRSSWRERNWGQSSGFYNRCPYGCGRDDRQFAGFRQIRSHIARQGTQGVQRNQGAPRAQVSVASGGRAFQCALNKARAFLNQNQSRHGLRSDVVTLIDYDAPASSRRMQIVNLRTGEIRQHNVARGSGGISSGAGSRGSPLGFMRFSETYNGKHGLSLRVDGLENRNRNSRSRAIVLHGAHYVTDGVHAGRSWGCFAVDRNAKADIIRRVKSGGLIFAYQGRNAC